MLWEIFLNKNTGLLDYSWEKIVEVSVSSDIKV